MATVGQPMFTPKLAPRGLAAVGPETERVALGTHCGVQQKLCV